MAAARSDKDVEQTANEVEMFNRKLGSAHLTDRLRCSVLQYAFKKVAKTEDFIRLDELPDAVRHAGQNPSEDVVQTMIERAKVLIKTNVDNPRNSIDIHCHIHLSLSLSLSRL
jgi:Ca2+-binding EF-hand superfamily protein